jgi:hypothetical protein
MNDLSRPRKFPLLETLWKDRNSAEHDMLAELVLRQFEAKGDPLKLLEVRRPAFFSVC